MLPPLLPVLPPVVLGGLVEGFPLLESGVVLGGFEVVLPLFDVPDESGLLLELPVVAELPLLLVFEPELLMLPLWPD